MLLLYSKLDHRVVPLVLMLKQWSKSRKINGAGNVRHQITCCFPPFLM